MPDPIVEPYDYCKPRTKSCPGSRRLDEALPLSLRLVLVLAGATSWAVSSFLTSAAWFSIALSAAVAQGLFLASKRGAVTLLSACMRLMPLAPNSTSDGGPFSVK